MSENEVDESTNDEIVDVEKLSNEEKSAFCRASCPTTMDGHSCHGVCGKRKAHPGRHRCFAGHSWS